MDTKTYTETHGNIPFNWYEALNSETIDWVNLQRKSRNWVTCACGNQCDIIPRDKLGIPLDWFLSYAGISFNMAILYFDKEFALQNLDIIEKRSLILIKEMKSSCESK